MKDRTRRILVFSSIAVVCVIVGVLSWNWYDNSVDRSGWVEKDGQRYYKDFHARRVTGWQEIDGTRYYFDENAVMQSGWVTMDGQRCFFNEDGTLYTGWLEQDGSTFYLTETGAMATGWQEIDGGRYYFDENGHMASGWLDLDGSRYYLGEDGAAITGQITLDGDTYCFAEDGAMVTGWANQRYYLPDGIMATGWADVEDRRYYFKEDGTAYVGWLREGEYSYYLTAEGAATSPTEIDEKTYYFSPSGIHIWLVNPWNEIHDDYEVELVSAEYGHRVAAICQDPLIKMLEDCRAAGLNPAVCSSYRTYWDQLSLYKDSVEKHGAAVGRQIVAVPNTSEHQLGLAVDIVDSLYRKLDKTQEETAVQKWLMEHCWEYGFILRYPNDTTDLTGIIYEPWHYRYVGTEVSLELRDLGITLEEYLGAANPE